MKTISMLRRMAGAAMAFVCLGSAPAWAQPAPWAERIPVELVNNSPDALINHQVRLEFDTAALVAGSRLNADGSDLRFGTDAAGTTLIPHWIDSGINTANTVVWISAPEISANGSVAVWMYLGNPAATNASALDGVFPPSAAVQDDSSTLQVDSGAAGGVTNSQRGFRFVPNEDVLMVAMGKREPTGSTRYITLFDVATQAKLEQMQIAGPPGAYTYQPLPQPRWLLQGQQYLIEMYQGDTDGYYFGASSQIHPKLTYLDMRYCNGCDQDTYPNNFLNGIHYGYPDLLLRARKAASPQPSGAVGPVSSITTLTSDATPSNFGSDVLLTATVVSTLPPTGTVTFGEGGDPLCADVPLVAGQAQCLVQALPVGIHTFEVAYSGVALNVQPSADTFDQDVVATVPDAPTALTAVPGHATILLDFTPPVFDGGASIGSFTATCNDGVSDFAVTGFAPLLLEGLADGTTFDCTVYATNSVGDGPAAGPVQATTPSVPDAPIALTATPGNGTISLDFAAPAFDGGAAIESFTAICTNAPDAFTITGFPPLLFEGLDNGTTYDCVVYATNIVGDGPAAGPVQATPLMVPDAPTGLAATPGDSQLRLDFEIPVFDGGTPVLDYTALCDDGTSVASATGAGPPLVVDGLTNGVPYTCAVYARNSVGDSALSVEVVATPVTVPRAPAVYPVPGESTVTLHFDTPDDGGSPILGYEASCTDGVATFIVIGTVSPLRISGLVNLTTYSCSVFAHNAIGDGSPSLPVSATPRVHLLLLDGFEGEPLQ